MYIYACVDVITSVFRLTLHELSEYLGFTLCLIASGCGVQVLMFVHPCRVLGSHSSHLLFAAENWNSWKVGPNLFLEDLQTISTYVRILSPYFHLYFTYHVHHRFRYIPLFSDMFTVFSHMFTRSTENSTQIYSIYSTQYGGFLHWGYPQMLGSS